MFSTTRLVGHQPYAPAAFTPGEIPGTHFQGLSQPQGTWFCRGEPWKKSPVTPPGIDPGTVRLVAQCLDHYATPAPLPLLIKHEINLLHFFKVNNFLPAYYISLLQHGDFIHSTVCCLQMNDFLLVCHPFVPQA